jgi:hypothetical protein
MDDSDEDSHEREAQRRKYDAPRGWFIDEAERRVRDDPDNIISITDASELFGVEVAYQKSFDSRALRIV